MQENAGNMGMRLLSMQTLWKYLEVNIFMVSYRGYGRSEGIPDEAGIKLDAEAVIGHVASRTDIDSRRLVVLGRSLGGAVGVYVASRYILSSRPKIQRNHGLCAHLSPRPHRFI